MTDFESRKACVLYGPANMRSLSLVREAAVGQRQEIASLLASQP